jgi:hypothetical protein
MQGYGTEIHTEIEIDREKKRGEHGGIDRGSERRRRVGIRMGGQWPSRAFKLACNLTLIIAQQ